jgi:hypothetical protein
MATEHGPEAHLRGRACNAVRKACRIPTGGDLTDTPGICQPTSPVGVHVCGTVKVRITKAWGRLPVGCASDARRGWSRRPSRRRAGATLNSAKHFAAPMNVRSGSSRSERATA